MIMIAMGTFLLFYVLYTVAEALTDIGLPEMNKEDEDDINNNTTGDTN